ncbi:MAG TPA: prepilin-type N-terminal cleavage/methylation domain-containing protein [Gammaproteobacteria bacterium]|nr:prepilin-type N-terminal cleavage/methylation domain-containing protein [Gammaproteobacteria bacterium]
MFGTTPKLQAGFTLVEIMVVIVILGMLAGLAIPAYYDYVVRTNVSNMLSSADTVRSAVAETRLQYGNFDQIIPGDALQTFTNLGVEDPTLINPALSSVLFAVQDENHMAIVLCGATIGEGADSAANTVDLFLTANVYLGGLKWGCMYQGNNPAYVPSNCRTLYDPGIYGVLSGNCPRTAPQAPI